MTESVKSDPQHIPAVDVEDLVAEADTGARHPKGLTAKILTGTAFLWTLFQVWYASPLPFMLNFGVFNSTEARAIHLMFAIFLAFTAFPAFRHSPRSYIPIQDWVFALVGGFCAAYIYIFYVDLSNRPGLPTTLDLVVAVVGLVLLLEATRRALGPPLMVVAIVFLAYTFLGPYMPEVIAHKGASLNKGMSHYWLTTEGVFGVALGVSTSMVFLFVLFGSLLEKAGGGQLLHPRRLRPARPLPRRTGQGGGGVVGADRGDLRLVDRQRGDHRHLHHSPDEAGRLPG